MKSSELSLNPIGRAVLSPETLKEPQITEQIQSWNAEVGVVVAFGQILTEAFMNSFPLGCVNVHGSLLPRWRGAAPIQRSIEAGDKVTGVTLQKMVKRLDAGDVIGGRSLDITPEMDAKELHDKLADLGADLLRVELMDYVRGNLVPLPQDEAKVTYAKKIEKAESQIDWNLPAEKIHNKVRAFVMGPGTFATIKGMKLKIHKTRPAGSSKRSDPPGSLVSDKSKLLVQTGEGLLELLVVQPESRNKMTAVEFLKGYPS
jgi:methionyl-tRNA formyltransferase